MTHGFSQAIKTLNVRAATGPPESQTFAKLFEAFAREGAIQKIAHFFVCCFQRPWGRPWSMASLRRQRSWVRVGFDAKALEQEFVAQTVMPPFSNGTFSILYDDARLCAIYEQIVDSMFQLISLPRGKSLPKEVINAFMGQLQFWLTYHVLQAMLYFKHEAYSNEQEYRFLQIFRADAEPEVRFRQRSYSLVRYREFDWKNRYGQRSGKL